MIASCGMFASVPFDHREDERADEREAPDSSSRRPGCADRRPARARATAIVAPSDGDLRERQVDEDDAALDDVQAEIRVDAGDHQRGDHRRREKLQNECSPSSAARRQL